MILLDYVVLIDSNAIIGNGYKIKSDSINVFFKSNQLVIASPTIDEVIKNYDILQEENENKLNDAVRNAKRYGVKSEFKKLEKVDFDSLFHQELEGMKAITLGNEEACIEFIYNKSLWLEKPFKKNNKGKEIGGFRDALIWNLWLVFLQNNHYKYNKVIIINMDNDFVKDGKLNDDLTDDLENSGIPNEKVIVLNNIKSFMEEIVLNYSRIEPVDDFINEEDMKNIQSDIIDKATSEGLKDAINSTIVEHYSEENEPNIDFIGRKNNVHIDTISGSKESLYLYFTEAFTVSVSYFIGKSDYLVDQLKNVSVLESDWNDWVMHVSEDFEIEVGFESYLNLYHWEIEEFGYYVDEKLTPLIEGSYYDD